jgi:hypothetical protein
MLFWGGPAYFQTSVMHAVGHFKWPAEFEIYEMTTLESRVFHPPENQIVTGFRI